MPYLNQTPIQAKYLRVFFYSFLILAFADKLYMLIHYGFKFTDDDQMVLCLAAKDMLHGHFYQPCFYGQAYNPLIESFLAVPFLALKIPVYMALPLVTGLLGLFPFILFAFLLRKNFPLASMFSLALPVALPWFYSALAIMPRGFVTGIAIASVPCVMLLLGKEKKLKYLMA